MFSYHAVVHALEGRAGVTALERFWLALRHASSAHVPYARYNTAGRQRARAGASPGEIERWVADWLSTDLNPAAQVTRMVPSVSALVEGYNAYNEASHVAVRTTVNVLHAGNPGEPGLGGVQRRRELIGTRDDPEPCRIATYAVFDGAATRAAAGQSGAHALLTAADVAARLGLEGSASAQAAAVFESRGNVPMPQLAGALGVSVRALQRKLREEGGSAEQIRACCRLVAACRLLPGTLSLTEVALEVGFSDSAHLSRSLKASCGLTPTQMRRAVSPRSAATHRH